jgi:hypothetical protein
VWRADEIVEILAETVRERESALREEQAVYGLDALDEAELQPIFAAGFAAAGLGVLREQGYPTQWKRKRRGADDVPLPRDRERCDLVLTPAPGQIIADSFVAERAAGRARREAAGTLFESVSEPVQHAAANAVAPDEAYWLELKVVAQYSVESGVPGPNRAYGSQLTRFAAADIGKLSCDRTIVHGGLALVLFTADERTAVHDSGILLDRLLNRGLRITSPVTMTVPILDRIGNAVCTLVLAPLRPAPPVDD